MELEKLLSKVSLKEYQEFVLNYALKDPEFKTELEVYFADKDGKIDLNKKYSQWIKKTIQKYEHRGFITYKDSMALAGDLQNIINTGFVLSEKQNFLDAFTLAQVALKETMEVITYSDDSSGSIGDTVGLCIELLERIATDPDAGNPLKKDMFSYLEQIVKTDIYFDYGDFGFQLMELFGLLAMKNNQHEAFLKHLDTELSKPVKPHSDYNRNFYTLKKIEILTAIGRQDETVEIAVKNMDIVEVRQAAVDQAIASADFDQAKTLITEGIKIAEEKSHPGTVSEWQKQLLRIAMLEKDVATIRVYSKNFALYRGLARNYYQIWKGTYAEKEWTGVIDAYIRQSITTATEAMALSARKGWQGQSLLSLLRTVAEIYIEEGYLDRLMALVQKETSLGNILFYHQVLLKDYSQELLQLYVPAIKSAGVDASDRRGYQELVKQMKKIIKDIPEGKEPILAVARELRLLYYRRPAMVQELTKLIGGLE